MDTVFHHFYFLAQYSVMWAKPFPYFKKLRMKNILLSVLASLFLFAANAQTDTTKTQTDTTQVQTDSTKVVSATAATTTSSNLVTLDSNLPEHLKGVTSSTVQPKHYLPVLGAYATTDGATNLTIAVDEQNIGIVWIDGLPQGRVKAFLKKSPATYKIPAQKTADGKAIAEGTLVYDKDTKQLWLCTGCAYNEADPAATFTGKTKAKVWQLNRVEETTAATTEVINQ